jgi:branched-chain amino acid transport system ATP-binding protein
VTLQVAPGEILGIIGSNGAGKTTTFDLCSGFLPPSAGQVLLDGVDVTGEGAASRARRGLARTFQDARLFPALTVKETLSVALERHTTVRDPFASTLGLHAARESEQALARTVDELLELMRLGHYRDAFISELSTGTRRVVELACALGHQPRVLLLDEPSSGIAQRESEALGELLLDIRERTGASMVLIEHDIPLVSGVSDRLACMHLGEVIAEGAPDAVLRHPEVVSSYLGQDDSTIHRSGNATSSDANWITTAEYARRHQLSVLDVRRLVRAGDVPSHRGPHGYLIACAQKENA